MSDKKKEKEEDEGFDILNIDDLDYCKNEECFFNQENHDHIAFGPHKHNLVRILKQINFIFIQK